jgi:hypothetical protein
LKGLLDGHPDLVVSPVQDGLIGGFSAALKFQEICETKDLESFRRHLALKTNYYRIEKYARWGYVIFSPDAETVCKLPFDFDFDSFDRAFIEEIYSGDVWTPRAIIDAFVRNFMRAWSQLDHCDTHGFVTMEANPAEIIPFVAECESAFKYIYVDRCPEGIIATRYQRKPIDGFVDTKGWGTHTLSRLIGSGEVERIVSKRKQAFDMQKCYPERFYVLNMEEMVSNPSRVMPGLATFIGIEYDEILKKFTYLGRDFNGSDRFIGAVNDTPESIFEPKDLKKLRGEILRVEANRRCWRIVPKLKRVVGRIVSELK